VKFQRNYKLTIELPGFEPFKGVPYKLPPVPETIVIEPPFTLNFNIQRNCLASMNTGTFSILNLKEPTRRKIFHDRYDTTNYRYIELRAGYSEDMPIIFQGNLRQAYSVRSGTEWTTDIEAFDGGFAAVNGFTSQSFPAQSNLRDILTGIIKDMPKALGSNIGNYDQSNSRGVSILGNSWQEANKLIGYDSHAFIDLETVNILKLNEYIDADTKIIKITSESGMLDTPKRFDTYLQLKMLFEPHIKVGQIVEIESLETIVNGQYKVIGVSHAGTISEATSGQCTTTLSLFLGAALLRVQNFQGIPARQ
jgi:hypothetical protein